MQLYAGEKGTFFGSLEILPQSRIFAHIPCVCARLDRQAIRVYLRIPSPMLFLNFSDIGIKSFSSFSTIFLPNFCSQSRKFSQNTILEIDMTLEPA